MKIIPQLLTLLILTSCAHKTYTYDGPTELEVAATVASLPDHTILNFREGLKAEKFNLTLLRNTGYGTNQLTRELNDKIKQFNNLRYSFSEAQKKQFPAVPYVSIK